MSSPTVVMHTGPNGAEPKSLMFYQTGTGSKSGTFIPSQLTSALPPKGTVTGLYVFAVNSDDLNRLNVTVTPSHVLPYGETPPTFAGSIG